MMITMNAKAYKYLIPNVILASISIIIGIFVPETLVQNATISIVTSIWIIVVALTYDVLNMPYEYQKNNKFFEQISRPDGFQPLLERLTTQVEEIWNDRHVDFGFIFLNSIVELEDCYIRIATAYNHGVIHLEGDLPLEKTTECFKKVGKTVFATSFADEESKNVWQSDRMNIYLAANREAVERGVDVTRVFIFESKQQLLDKEFQTNILKKQLDIKITERKRLKVYVIHISDILLGGDVPDFSLYDDCLVSTWKSLKLNKIDMSSLECNEQARRRARSIRDHLLAPGRAKFLQSLDDIDSIVKNWRT